jgi:hypothetical protein
MICGRDRVTMKNQISYLGVREVHAHQKGNKGRFRRMHAAV